MKIYNIFDPKNSIGLIYNSLTSNPLRDSKIEVEHLEKIKEYIEYLEKSLLSFPKYGLEKVITLQNLREHFINEYIRKNQKQ